jgi:hypothetical protein
LVAASPGALVYPLTPVRKASVEQTQDWKDGVDEIVVGGALLASAGEQRFEAAGLRTIRRADQIERVNHR